MITTWFGLDYEAIQSVIRQLQGIVDEYSGLRESLDCHDDLALYIKPELKNYFDSIKKIKRLTKININKGCVF